MAVAISIVGGMWLGTYLSGHKSRNSAEDKFNMILSLIENDYVDSVDMNNIIELTIPELLSNLDPHSTYIPARDLKAVNDELEGSFSGIGIQFSIMNDTITVVEAISGGPSEKIGILAGDRIIEVNDSIRAGTGVKNEQVF